MIYFAQPTNGGPIRIGATSNPFSRKKALGTWLPGGVEYIATVEGGFLGEAILHQCFNPIRIDGGKDWFRSCEAMWRFIIELSHAVPEWLTLSKTDLPKITMDSLQEEFGETTRLLNLLGYSGLVTLAQALKNQTLLGYGLPGRVEFLRLLRDGKFPPYIEAMHSGVKSRLLHNAGKLAENGRAVA